ncbi:GspE/PulE family protein [Desulfosoma caldarium]|uniref:General secretion pathway protein E/type IV pilus assembly protein PilB n=1 Tax=Desulfosoma caldarium TaxID=610254 RepID=A0A3N1ULS6_9BACT|nr:GspE/PulE family protein [Desulfosoma caldarium]ROQ90668.1 general secretion pathway protein E/type IV pilus assembly protein PilB [Desulfosoma caldarium]
MDTAQAPKKPIGQLLKEKGYLKEEQIDFALREQKATGERLGEVLTRLGIVTEFEMAEVLADQVGLPFWDPRGVVPESRALLKIPPGFARDRTVLPFKLTDGVLHVAVGDPMDRGLRDGLASFVGSRFKAYVGPSAEIRKLAERHYHFLQNPPEQNVQNLQSRLATNPNAAFSMDELWADLLNYAILHRATDVHLSPTDQTTRFFTRIDGFLDLAFVFPLSIHQRLVSALKARAGMDISEQRLPQDGRWRFEFMGEIYDLRISTVRSPFGENLVIRLLPTQAVVFPLGSLGFSPEEVQAMEALFRKPYGMVLISGPTGSGKTTTLYGALRMLDVIHLNVLTAEDPVEYRFPLIRQTQVAEDIGYDFADAVRHFLRQDPDVILIGEIRDEKTATMALRAALTGHLVLSTVHANNAVAVIARLRDMNVSADVLAATLLGSTAQRLVRKVCPFCRAPYRPDGKLLARYGLSADRDYLHGTGCEACRGRGYLGRTAVTEILQVSDACRALIAEGKSLQEFLNLLAAEGFQSMRHSAAQKIATGQTTVEEAERVLG